MLLYIKLRHMHSSTQEPLFGLLTVEVFVGLDKILLSDSSKSQNIPSPYETQILISRTFLSLFYNAFLFRLKVYR